MSSLLFEQFKCKGLSLENRFVMAPMTRTFSPDGIPGDNVAEYYARRAAAHVGLIITEGTVTDRPGSADNNNYPKFYGETAINAWKNVVTSTHSAGGKIAPQLWHVGMIRKPGTGHNPDAQTDGPSGITHSGKSIMPAPTDEEVADMVSSYARSARDAKTLGFDAIEIHGAHGYLIDQFFWGVMNKREGKYGGGFIERAKFAADVIRECRREIGNDMPIILRWSQWKQQEYTARLVETPKEMETFLKVFVDAGVDILHCSQRRFWEPEFENSSLNLAGWAKKLTGLPTISVGSVGLNGDFFGAFAGQSSQAAPLDKLYEMMDRKEFDLIAVGRALLQDPEWVKKVKEGRMDEMEDYDGKALSTLY